MTRTERIVQYIFTCLAVFMLLVLYAPVIVGAMFSVVSVTRAGIDWHSATLGWYVQLWSNTSILDAIRTTFVVGVIAVASSVVLSVVLALYVEWEGAIGRRIIEVVVYLAIPNGPGLGVELDPDKVARFTQDARPLFQA